MNYDYYKAASEATDADERALIPGFKRIRLSDERIAELEAMAKHHPARQESPADPDAAEALDQLEQANEGEQ